jgi:hypothetical protein
MIYVLTYLSIFLIYHKKQLRVVSVKKKIRVQKIKEIIKVGSKQTMKYT